MFIVSDDVDGSYYLDLIIDPDELKRIQHNEMISGEVIIKRRKYYLGIRLKGTWDFEDGDYKEEDREGF